MTRLAALFALSAFTLSAGPALADEQDNQVWTNVTVQQKLGGKLLLWAETQGRFGDDASRLSQSIIRPGLGYQASPTVTVWAGYARVTNPGPGLDVKEDRLWQQLSWNAGKVLGGALSSRSRLEQRNLNTGDDTGWRLRQLFKYDRPFGETGGPSLVVTSETFVAVNDTDWGVRGGFDQMRNFAGVGFPVAPKTRVEVGYLNQYINRVGDNDRTNHIASFSLLKRL
jgi:hypothetical protein